MLTGTSTPPGAAPGGPRRALGRGLGGAAAQGRAMAAHGQLHVVAEVTATLGAEDQLWNELCVLAERSQRRAGNLRYEILRDIGDPGHFLICQTWASREWFWKYLDCAAIIEHTTAIAALAQIPLQMTVCQMQPAAPPPAPCRSAPAQPAYPPGASSPPP
ncbi:putative quinol monooxygenase [Mycobacteroides abscessus]|uniref:putative quinol monooxygenase n=1 Tax=Mycobacteroides abscessus TaxID=36809 RepID=UPI0006961F73|nr:antibiotic biosynthesis monooxygenase family protein [Mycobacteroides abscessus]MBN7322824.1 antibiotic biosynthesis monooxygenase [Mycobacteroides abscessus subsp. massiliense]MBN7388174.1 antibiotic biosynthesis monooxygenase [Mycobacteroides abscessus subsp. abscessus]MBN7417681.1 antibiotic biosynthesis monooxygenase [Mycobacteroides abscessus subsp. abscessus]MBN7488730.1 antibiotic biosynthesis monooxygenase [Mycobacteroides abscessus subsp. abscessus]MBN7503079.1 antibiotic biosynthe